MNAGAFQSPAFEPAGRVPVGSPKRALLYGVIVLLVPLVVFSPVRQFEFLTYDDAGYVTNSTQVPKGLTRETVRSAFTSFEFANWHPLTTISLALDTQLFGLNPGAFHLTNVVLHALAAVVLFVALTRMTASPDCSAIVALLFAVHPLHVESVAWIAERKDVLSGLFWMLTMFAYAVYVERPGAVRYLAVVALFAMGLMAKPMLVTLPFVLLLLDGWPLGRARHRPIWPLIREKLPLLALVGASCVVTYRAQQAAGAVSTFERIPLPGRLANALLSTVTYLAETVVPTRLSVFVPLRPRSFEEPAVWGAGAILLILSTAAALQVRRRPYLLVGWLWYLGTLVPVIGIVQVGAQAHADRYTYLPLVGVFIAVVWLAANVLAGPRFALMRLTLAAAVVCGCVWMSSRQLQFWRNSEALFQHSIEVVGDTPQAHFALATYYRNKTDYERAVVHCQRTLELDPSRAMAWSVLGYCQLRCLRPVVAGLAFSHVPTQGANSAADFSQLGRVALDRGLFGAAAAFFAQSIRLQPNDSSAYLHLAVAMWKQQALDPARAYLEEARKLEPGIVDEKLWAELNRSLPPAGSDQSIKKAK